MSAGEDRSRVLLPLHDAGNLTGETMWCTDLGPAPGKPGARRLRLGNVTSCLWKPTVDDVVIGTPIEGRPNMFQWDEGDYEDAGRWCLVLGYRPARGVTDAAKRLDDALTRAGVKGELAGPPVGRRPGVFCCAVPRDKKLVQLLAELDASKLEMVIEVLETPGGGT